MYTPSVCVLLAVVYVEAILHFERHCHTITDLLILFWDVIQPVQSIK